jgi:L-alanine-DL-glutamate epimerase-like enolase superfamily enzyme
LIKALESLELLWIEETLPPDDQDGYHQLVAQRSYPNRNYTGEPEY